MNIDTLAGSHDFSRCMQWASLGLRNHFTLLVCPVRALVRMSDRFSSRCADTRQLTISAVAIVLLCSHLIAQAEDSVQSKSNPLTTYGVITADEVGIAFVRYEVPFGHPAQRVWDAITDPESRLKFFATTELKLGGEVSIQFSKDFVEFGTITELKAPFLLEYVNVETNGHPARYYLDRLEITPKGDTCTVAFTTPLGPKGPVQLKIAAGWHVWIENWQRQLDDPDLVRSELDQTQPAREQKLLAKYIDQLVGLYPGWEP